MTKPSSIKIDDIEYVRKDSIQAAVSPPPSVEGLKYAIVRSRNQGVMAGYVKNISGTRVTLLFARQLWSWGSSFVLTDLAEFGPSAKGQQKYSAEMTEPAELLEACGVLFCTAAAERDIRAVKAQEPGK